MGANFLSRRDDADADEDDEEEEVCTFFRGAWAALFSFSREELYKIENIRSEIGKNKQNFYQNLDFFN